MNIDQNIFKHIRNISKYMKNVEFQVTAMALLSRLDRAHRSLGIIPLLAWGISHGVLADVGPRDVFAETTCFS